MFDREDYSMVNSHQCWKLKQCDSVGVDMYSSVLETSKHEYLGCCSCIIGYKIFSHEILKSFIV